MSDEEARRKFDLLTQQLHDCGWDVMAVIVKSIPGGTDLVQRTLLSGDSQDRARAFFRCNRAFRDELATASDALAVMERGFARTMEAVRRNTATTCDPYEEVVP